VGTVCRPPACRRCYGIVGDALNPDWESTRCGATAGIEFIHVRHEEYGGFAAVADAYLTGDPVAICGTAGTGVTHLINAMIDARKEGAPIIVIAGDVETSIIDTDALEELNPYQFFQSASLYTGRIVNPHQVRAVVQTALRTALAESRTDGYLAAGRRRVGAGIGRARPDRSSERAGLAPRGCRSCAGSRR
jgi:pyruvate dehydrogenase (quinone)